MFKYSEREGTYAHKKLPDDVPEAVKGERLQHIIALQEGISRQTNQQQVGRTVEVLVEARPSGRPPMASPLLRPHPAGQDGDFPATSSKQLARIRPDLPHHLAHPLWRPHRRHSITSDTASKRRRSEQIFKRTHHRSAIFYRLNISVSLVFFRVPPKP